MIFALEYPGETLDKMSNRKLINFIITLPPSFIFLLGFSSSEYGILILLV